MPRKRLSGPRKLYRHVGATPVTLKLTPAGVVILDAVQTRTGLSRGDVFEWLLRTHGDAIPEGLLEQADAEGPAPAPDLAAE